MKTPYFISTSGLLRRLVLLLATAIFVLLPQPAAAGLPEVVKRVCEWVVGSGETPAEIAAEPLPFKYYLFQDYKTPTKYHVEYIITSPQRERLKASAAVEKEGSHRTLELFFVLKGVLTGARIPGFEGEDQYRKVMEHFAGQFNRIQGHWGQPYSDNLDQANKLTASGLSLEEAAKLTWSGRQAAKYGYTEVTVDYLDLADWTPGKGQKGTRGEPGDYDQVLVYFSKPAN